MLYDATTIDALVWPDTQEGAYCRKYLEPIVKQGIKHYVPNIAADIYVLKVDDFIFPVIVPMENATNSYVCSPYQHYITYGKQNINLISNPMLSNLVKPLMGVMDKFSKAGKLDAVVYVNNWLFALDLYPCSLTKEHFALIVELLKAKFDKRTIIFRSLNAITNAEAINELKAIGCEMIASRMVYISNVRNEEIFKTRIFKSDLRLRNQAKYRIVEQAELSDEDIEEIFKLRNLFCIVQHSALQPEMSPAYMHLLFKQNLLTFKALKQDGKVRGAIGYFQRSNVMYCPLIAFDKTSADQAVIYRLLNTELLLEAKKQAHFFNQSAGASFYKSIRRAEPTLEFMAVYTQHLPLKQKLLWRALKLSMNSVGTYYMRKF